MASSARTWLQAPVVYITPSTTIDVASTPRAVRALISWDQASPSWPTLAVVIRASGLKRCSEYVRPCASQFCGSVSAATMRAPVTFGAIVVPAHPTRKPATSSAALIRLIVIPSERGRSRRFPPRCAGGPPPRAAPSLAQRTKIGQEWPLRAAER